jgi:hypothetical protein
LEFGVFALLLGLFPDDEEDELAEGLEFGVFALLLGLFPDDEEDELGWLPEFASV